MYHRWKFKPGKQWWYGRWGAQSFLCHWLLLCKTKKRHKWVIPADVVDEWDFLGFVVKRIFGGHLIYNLIYNPRYHFVGNIEIWFPPYTTLEYLKMFLSRACDMFIQGIHIDITTEESNFNTIFRKNKTMFLICSRTYTMPQHGKQQAFSISQWCQKTLALSCV